MCSTWHDQVCWQAASVWALQKQQLEELLTESRRKEQMMETFILELERNRQWILHWPSAIYMLTICAVLRGDVFIQIIITNMFNPSLILQLCSYRLYWHRACIFYRVLCQQANFPWNPSEVNWFCARWHGCFRFSKCTAGAFFFSFFCG